MDEVDIAVAVVVIGLGATAFMDVFAWVQNRLFKSPGLNYALVGRWILGMGHGKLQRKLQHSTIVQSPSVRFEKSVGWATHYAIGVGFVGCMVMITGSNWLMEPSLWQAILLGIISVLAPFFIMQPAFGFGLAASKTPAPWMARTRSMIAHLSFGVGVYFAGLVWQLIVRIILNHQDLAHHAPGWCALCAILIDSRAA